MPVAAPLIRCWSDTGRFYERTNERGVVEQTPIECQTVVMPDANRIGLCPVHANEILGPVGA